jgi:hypothetical protein
VPFHDRDYKADLLVLAKEVKEPVQYASVKIASAHGHQVLFTPPYHPELQPIEVVWAVTKNRIGCNPAKSMSDLGDKLSDSLGRITSHTWTGALTKVKQFEDKYLATADGEPLADDDDEDLSDADDDVVDELLGGIEL